ncbi:hypothetical protein HZC08_00900, partial [Candidatus Micrarchaeota archaeon]|nr:hypothetical protein [Candidatus Micrarchaeota archaeon]
SQSTNPNLLRQVFRENLPLALELKKVIWKYAEAVNPVKVVEIYQKGMGRLLEGLGSRTGELVYDDLPEFHYLKEHYWRYEV